MLEIYVIVFHIFSVKHNLDPTLDILFIPHNTFYYDYLQHLNHK